MNLLALIPAQYRVLALGLAAAILLVLAATGTAKVQAWRYEQQLADLRSAHAAQLQLIAQASERAIRAQGQARLQLETQLDLLDTQRYGELRNAQTNNDRLAADLAAAGQRLSVRTTAARCPAQLPATPGGASLDDGADRADIHPAVAGRLVRLMGEADECAIKLTGLQERERAVTQ